MKFKLFFQWRDLWVGLFIDNKNYSIYICPIPMFGIKITLNFDAMHKLRKIFIPHYQIFGSYTNEHIGCCFGRRGKKEALEEEPGSTFKRIPVRKCHICK